MKKTILILGDHEVGSHPVQEAVALFTEENNVLFVTMEEALAIASVHDHKMEEAKMDALLRMSEPTSVESMELRPFIESEPINKASRRGNRHSRRKKYFNHYS